ncbi:hypothetical protein MBLNU457_4565t2 [Dothideomycetes sp. NU457]
MGTMLRDWLGACLVDKLGAAIEWKKHRPGGAKGTDEIKEEPLDDDSHEMIDDGNSPDTTFSYDHSNFYINVEPSFELGENTFLQIKDVNVSEERFPVILSDGRTMIRAEFDEDVVRLFEKRHQRKLTQIVGGMINPSEFTIRATPLGDKQLGIVLVIRNFTYRKGSAGTGSAGHPKYAHTLPSVLELLGTIRKLMHDDIMRGSSPVSEGALDTTQGNTRDILQQLDPISDPPSQTELASQEFATQAPIRNRPRKPVPDLSVAPGTNLARPVKLAPKPQKKADSTCAKNLLAMIGFPQASVQPAPEPPASTEAVELRERHVEDSSRSVGCGSEERPCSSRAAAVRSDNTSKVVAAERQSPDGAAEPVDASPLKIVDEKNQMVSTPHSVHNIDSEQEQASIGAHPEPRAAPAESVVAPNNVPHPETKAAEVTEESSTLTDFRRPNPKYIKYARRRIDRSQRELIDRPQSWCPSETKVPFRPYNIPADLLKELAAAHEEIHIRNEDPVGTQRSNVDLASNEDRSHDADGQDLEKDEPENSQPFSSWPASPEAHLLSRLILDRNELPVDSSAPEPPPASPSKLGRDDLPFNSSASDPPSSSLSTSSDAMDLDEDSEGSDNSELAQALPRPLRTEHSLHHQVIKATPVESIANVKAGLKTPVQHSSSIVLESTARPSGQIRTPERHDQPNRKTSSAAKRPLENLEETAPKPKKLHKQPINWGTDEECKEDPVKKLQREKAERLRKEHEQAPAAVDNSKPPFSFKLMGSPRVERDQDPSERRHTDRAPLDDGAEPQSQISSTNGESDKASKTTPGPFDNPHRKLDVERVDVVLGPGWFSGIPDQMRNGATNPTQLSSKVLKKLAFSVQDGDNIQALVSAWQQAIERRCGDEVRPAGYTESQWAGLLPRDIEWVTYGRRVAIAEGKVDPLSSLGSPQSRINHSIASPAVVGPSTESATSNRTRNAFAQQRERRGLPSGSVDRPYLHSPTGDTSSPLSGISFRGREIERTVNISRNLLLGTRGASIDSVRVHLHANHGTTASIVLAHHLAEQDPRRNPVLARLLAHRKINSIPDPVHLPANRMMTASTVLAHHLAKQDPRSNPIPARLLAHGGTNYDTDPAHLPVGGQRNQVTRYVPRGGIESRG